MDVKERQIIDNLRLERMCRECWSRHDPQQVIVEKDQIRAIYSCSGGHTWELVFRGTYEQEREKADAQIIDRILSIQRSIDEAREQCEEAVRAARQEFREYRDTAYKTIEALLMPLVERAMSQNSQLAMTSAISRLAAAGVIRKPLAQAFGISAQKVTYITKPTHGPCNDCGRETVIPKYEWWRIQCSDCKRADVEREQQRQQEWRRERLQAQANCPHHCFEPQDYGHGDIHMACAHCGLEPPNPLMESV